MFDFLFKKPFGLEVTDIAIRVATAQMQGEIPLPQGAVIQGKIQDKTALTRALVDLKNKIPLSSFHCILALPEALCFKRTLKIPPEIKEGDLKEFLEEQVPKVIPLDPQQLHYDYALIQEGDQRFIWIVATQIEWLKDYQQCLESAGLKLVAAEPAGLSFLRLGVSSMDPKEITRLLISEIPFKAPLKDPFQIAQGAALRNQKAKNPLPQINLWKE